MCNIIKASVSNHLNLTLVSLILFCSSCEKSKNDLEQNEGSEEPVEEGD